MVLALAALLLVAGCSPDYAEQDTDSLSNMEAAEDFGKNCVEMSGRRQAECYADRAIAGGDDTLCYKIPAPADYATSEDSAHILEDRNRCFRDLAVKLAKSGLGYLCDEVKPGLVGQHPDICRYDVAQAARQVTSCLEVSEQGTGGAGGGYVYSRATCIAHLNTTLQESGCLDGDETCILSLGAMTNDSGVCVDAAGMATTNLAASDCAREVARLHALISPPPLSDVERFRKLFGGQQ